MGRLRCTPSALVDLNGAFDGVPVHKDVVTAIAKAHPQLPIQLGGGVRSLSTIEHYLAAGLDFIIIGTKAVEAPEFVEEACRICRAYYCRY